MEYLAAAKSRCARLYIGITNPDPSAITPTATDPVRSRADSNPFSYIDRHLMIEASLLEREWDRSDFCIVPAPILQVERLLSYLPTPKRTRAFITIYDEWGEQKAQEVARLGYDVEILWRRTHAERLTSGNYIRNAARTGGSWEQLVPRTVAQFIRNAAATGWTSDMSLDSDAYKGRGDSDA
jgi:hypothetical protein